MLSTNGMKREICIIKQSFFRQLIIVFVPASTARMLIMSRY